MKFTTVYQLIVKLSHKMTCESAKCYSTAIYTTIMVVLSLQLVRYFHVCLGFRKRNDLLWNFAWETMQ